MGKKTTQTSSFPRFQSNKGYQLLQRMGWQAGGGIGAQLQGRVDPVPIMDKRDQLGLGRDTLQA